MEVLNVLVYGSLNGAQALLEPALHELQCKRGRPLLLAIELYKASLGGHLRWSLSEEHTIADGIVNRMGTPPHA